MSPIPKLSSSGHGLKYNDDHDDVGEMKDRRNLFGAPYQSNGKVNENGFLTKPSTTQTINRSPTKHRRLGSLNGISGQSIRARLAVLREQVRVEDIALATATSDDHKLSKDCVGGWALTPAQMTYLQNNPYEYNASAGSILEMFCLQRFWIYLSRFIPKLMAPCTITAIGFFINLLTCSIMIVKSPDARSDQVSSWALLLCALGVFLYQIADALDGKQCYKVQNTQIEEYYDHGCDAVSTILLMYAVGIATQSGQYPVLFLLVIFSALFAFYTTHWLSYVTNQMVFGKIDVTEGQWSMIVIHTASALFGQQIWQINLVNIGHVQLTLGQLLALVSLATFSTAIIGNVSMILFGVKTPLEKCGVQIKRKQGFYNCVKPALPAIFLALLLMKVYTLGYYHLNTTFFILTFGFTFAKLTMKLVIAHCTNYEMELRDPALVAPIMLALNHYLMLIEPHKALLCALICNGIELIRYFTSVSWDLRVALDVDIFAIRYPPNHPKSRRDCNGFYVNGLNNQEVLKSQTTAATNKKDA